MFYSKLLFPLPIVPMIILLAMPLLEQITMVIIQIMGLLALVGSLMNTVMALQIVGLVKDSSLVLKRVSAAYQ